MEVKDVLKKMQRGLPVAGAILKYFKITNSEKAIRAIAAIKYVDAILNALINGEDIPNAPKELTEKGN